MMRPARSYRTLRCALLPILCLLGISTFTGQTREVDSGWCEWANPEGRTNVEAKQWVIEQAQIRALELAFGKRVSSETVHLVSEANGIMDEAFSELNVLQVKGEWVEAPIVEGPIPEIRNGDEIWWKVRVQGKARPIEEEVVDIELGLRQDVLCAQPVDFLQEGDRIRARFRSPVDGHVMFFYLEDGIVHALSSSRSEMAVEVEGQRTYTLFSTESEWLEANAEASGLHRLTRYAWGFLVTNEDMLESQAVLIGAFAPHSFAPPLMDWEEEGQIWSLGWEKFEKWIKQNKARSDGFQVERVPVRIKPKERY